MHIYQLIKIAEERNNNIWFCHLAINADKPFNSTKITIVRFRRIIKQNIRNYNFLQQRYSDVVMHDVKKMYAIILFLPCLFYINARRIRCDCRLISISILINHKFVLKYIDVGTRNLEGMYDLQGKIADNLHPHLQRRDNPDGSSEGILAVSSSSNDISCRVRRMQLNLYNLVGDQIISYDIKIIFLNSRTTKH